MQTRTWLVGAALAIAIAQCKSAARQAPAEPAGELTPAALFHPPDETPSAEPAEPATEPILPLSEPQRCPLALSGVKLSAEQVPNGISLVFFTAGDSDETERVQELARRFYDDLTQAPAPAARPPSTIRTRMSFSEAPGGAVIVFSPTNLDQLETLRDQLRRTERSMQDTQACPARLPSLLEIVER